MFDDLRRYKGERQRKRDRALRKARDYRVKLEPRVAGVLNAYRRSLRRGATLHVHTDALYMDDEEEYIPTARWCLQENVSLNKRHCRKVMYAHNCVTIEVNGHLRPRTFKVRLKKPPHSVDRRPKLEAGACVSGVTRDWSEENLKELLSQLTKQLKDLE